MKEITEIARNTKTGTILIRTRENKRWRALYRDNYGYFCRVKKYGKNYLVDRFLNEKDIEKIEDFLKR